MTIEPLMEANDFRHVEKISEAMPVEQHPFLEEREKREEREEAEGVYGRSSGRSWTVLRGIRGRCFER